MTDRYDEAHCISKLVYRALLSYEQQPPGTLDKDTLIGAIMVGIGEYAKKHGRELKLRKRGKK